MITIVFMSLERSGAARKAFDHSAADWDPSRLPSYPVAFVLQSKATPRPVAIAELVAGAISAIAILAILWGPMRIDMEHVQIAAAPIWTNLRWPLLVLCFANIAVGWFGLARPYSVRVREWFKVGIDTASLAVLGMCLRATNWITLSSTKLAPAALLEAFQWANFGMRIGLGIAALATGFTLVQSVLRLMSGRVPGYQRPRPRQV